tara:strand:- start:57642 stop:58742 length:1101 start_codon:yes stop_codon:yes gene_type:complete
MRIFIVLVAFALLAFHQPEVVEAQRYRPATKQAGKAKKSPRAAHRATARTKSKQFARPRTARPSGFARLGKKVRTSITLRDSVRTKTAATKAALGTGQLAAAAVEVSRSPTRNAKGQFVKGSQKLSTRERFAMWRSTRAVKKAALKQAKGRSAAGDVQGTVDALQALEVLESSGKLGVIARWQKAKATKKAFRNSRRSASKALKSGDLDTAGQNFALASELSPGSRTSKKMAATLMKESFKMASLYAKSGNTELTWNVLEMASAIAAEGGVKFSEKKAQKIVETAFVKALPILTKTAEQAYKAGNIEQAVASLAEARAIAGSGSVKTSRRVTKKHARLAKKLGPRLLRFEQAQAQAQQQQEQQVAE